MGKIKVLHLANDDKFVDQAFLVFEKAFPRSNDVFVLAESTDLEYVNLEPKKIIFVKRSRKRIPRIAASEYRQYDLVVFHSFGNLLNPEIHNIPSCVPAVWLGWGADYYDLIDDPKNLLLPETEKLVAANLMSKARTLFGRAGRLGFEMLGLSKSRKRAIEKLSIFSPVLPNEYDLVRKARNWKAFPAGARWNYGTIEDHLVKGVESEGIDDNAILVGNSASQTCNHIDTLKFLDERGFHNRKIVLPLSYGEKKYGQKVFEEGKHRFGKNFEPLMTFMPAGDYVATIKRCGYVIMNHKRQQAVGNIVIMLYLGARVFLREESPTYRFLLDMGIALSSVQELEKDAALLNSPLSDEERESNKQLVSDYWSRERGIQRTRALVDQALGNNRCRDYNVPAL